MATPPKSTSAPKPATSAEGDVSSTIKEDGDVQKVKDLGGDPVRDSVAEAAQDTYLKPEELPESTKVTPPAEQLVGPGPVGELQRFDKEDKGLDDVQPLPRVEGDDPSKRGREAVGELNRSGEDK